MTRLKKTLKLLFVADPLENFDPIAETSLALMREAARRKHRIFFTQPKNLSARGTCLQSHVQELKILSSKQKNAWYQVRSNKVEALENFNAILLRKDPPFDPDYLHHLYLLQLLSHKVYMMNHPRGILLANEKIFTLLFESWAPETLISANRQDLINFIQEQKQGTILKPIGEAGGRGVFYIKHPQSENVNVILESMSHNFSRHIIAQAYLPEAKKGDKRILLLGDQILGAFQRIPAKGEHRANLHAGGRAKKASVSHEEKKLISELQSHLQQLGLDFVGLDLIGNKLIEVNATSPMGLHELNQTAKRQSEKEVIDFLEKKVFAN
ncbi:MAG: glutathione synthase [Deltaproteobacteria bacterium]|nr:glutathione synthase [Deltaproteobacteria bacterium]